MMLDPGYRTGPAVNVGDPGAVIRRKGEVIEMVNLIWGFPPSEPGGRGSRSSARKGAGSPAIAA